MSNLQWKVTVNIMLMFTVLYGACFNIAYANNVKPAQLSAITATQIYINQQTVVSQGAQNIEYHPTFGYMDYQQVWCNGNVQSAIMKYQHFVEEMCTEKGGRINNHWCTLSYSQQPLFYTFIAPYDANCRDGNAIIVHIIEVMPTTKSDASVAKAWLRTAQSLHFLRRGEFSY